MRLTKLLDDAVSTPGKFEGDVHSPALVVGASIRLKTDAGAGSFRDDCHKLLAVHESLLLSQVEDLKRNVLFRARLVPNLTVVVAHDPRLATSHLRHVFRSAQHVDQLIESVGRETLTETFDLEEKFRAKLACILRIVCSERQGWQ